MLQYIEKKNNNYKKQCSLFGWVPCCASPLPISDPKKKGDDLSVRLAAFESQSREIFEHKIVFH